MGRGAPGDEANESLTGKATMPSEERISPARSYLDGFVEDIRGMRIKVVRDDAGAELFTNSVGRYHRREKSVPRT